MQQQPEERQRKLLSIAKPHTTGEKSQTYELKASSVVPWFGQQTVGHTQQSPEPYSTADVASCRNRQQMTAKALQHRWKHGTSCPTQHISKRAVASRWSQLSHLGSSSSFEIESTKSIRAMDPIIAMAALRRELERRLSTVEQSAGPEQRALSLRSVRELGVRAQAASTPRPHRGDRGGSSATAGQLWPMQGWLYW